MLWFKPASGSDRTLVTVKKCLELRALGLYTKVFHFRALHSKALLTFAAQCGKAKIRKYLAKHKTRAAKDTLKE
jgi:hypothetical protein